MSRRLSVSLEQPTKMEFGGTYGVAAIICFMPVTVYTVNLACGKVRYVYAFKLLVICTCPSITVCRSAWVYLSVSLHSYVQRYIITTIFVK